MTRAFADHHYRSADGLDLYARIYDGEPDRIPLLCMHGLTRNSADFQGMLNYLPDWPAISVDQRGRGNSTYDPDPSHYRPDLYCADMFGLLDGLGHKQVIAIGTSMGGLMTLMMANMRAGIFKAAIINDIGPEIDPAGLARLGTYVGQAMVFGSWGEAIDAIRAQGPDIFPDFTDADWQGFVENVCEQTDDGKIQFRYDPKISEGLKGDGTATLPPDLWPLYLDPAALPMLIIRGETSDILSAAIADRMVRERADARLVTVPNRGHAPMLTEPVAVAAIKDFLREQL